MKYHVLSALMTLCLAGTSNAAESGRENATAFSRTALPDLAVTRRDEIVTPLSHLPQLPEPEVFAMMLVGLVLIGYRVSRDGGDKFR
ncbi:PEP-CTERM sorting domain-containing protein [Massilia aurea]|uniref:PEP-CTERM sorting domain-containing protein n=1 Tax=Massilia aurea TaxID=373040 RepID=UPI0034631E32